MEFWVSGRSDLSVLITRQMGRSDRRLEALGSRSSCGNLAYTREPRPHIQSGLSPEVRDIRIQELLG